MRVGVSLKIKNKLKKKKDFHAKETMYTKIQRQETIWCVVSIMSIPRLINSGGINSYGAPETCSHRLGNLD